MRNLFRTMQPRSARAHDQSALSKFREHACIDLFCAMSEPHVTLSILQSRQAAGAMAGALRAPIAGSCVPGSLINHAELPRPALEF